MAYNLSDRFLANPRPIPLLEPAGVYQNTNSILIKHNKVPFLSKAPRKTTAVSTLWTHAIYYGDKPHKIPNCTSISSKLPRFKHESFSEEDIEEFLCKCGTDTTCECHNEEKQKLKIDKNICQGKIPRKIFKGITQRSVNHESFSSPSKVQNYKIMLDGSHSGIGKRYDPPFYDTNVKEHSAFYRGWKWSKWTSSRTSKFQELSPGPATYQITTSPKYDAICAEKVRAFKRKTSKQLRFIEMVQRKNILENLPGPSDYSPTSPKGTKLKFLGPKAERFIFSKHDDTPGPTNYFIKRDFDKDDKCLKICHAKLPLPAAFGGKAVRFKYPRDEGPSPAAYDSNYKPCHILTCTVAPFNSSSKRFKFEKENHIIDYESDLIDDVEPEEKERQKVGKGKELPCWEFRSKTTRMQPLMKKLDEPSPADLALSMNKKERDVKFQYACPFFSSKPRFQPWYNWIPVHGNENTPGPGSYELEPKFPPGALVGSISRGDRFHSNTFQTPAPNTYNIENGIETVLRTHNQILKDNIKNKLEFQWNPPPEVKALGLKEKESILLNNCIALLDQPDIFDVRPQDIDNIIEPQNKPQMKSKVLRCFVTKVDTK